MNGLFQAGAFFGALCISSVGDRFGRKMSITVPAMLVVISGALLAGSTHIAMFLTFRFFSGMGSFWLLGAIPVWMTEIVPAKNRGLLVDIHSCALLLGYAFASWMGYAFFFVKSVSFQPISDMEVWNFRNNVILTRKHSPTHGEDHSLFSVSRL
jgi:MFS family permease